MATVTREPTVGATGPPTTGLRRVRVPQLTVGLLLVAGAALAFVLWNAASVNRVAVLALAGDVTRGQVLAAEDLQVVQVGTDDGVAMTPADQVDRLIGGAVVADLPAGTLLVEEHLAVASALLPGSGVVGLALSPGQYPTPHLRVGDLVNVVATSADRPTGDLLVEAAEVVWVEPAGMQGQRFISLLAGEELAGHVAAAAARAEVRLVLVAREGRGSR